MTKRPAPGPLRAAVERRSGALLVFLSSQPRWLLPLVTVLLLAGGVLLPAAAAAVCLLVLVALLGWLAYLAWPVLDGRDRAVRLLGVALVLALGARSLLS